MVYKLVYDKLAMKDLEHIDPSQKSRIISKLEYFLTLKSPLAKAKKLKNFPFDAYRFRIGDYRVIFRVDEEGTIIVFVIVRIVHRKDAYKKQ